MAYLALYGSVGLIREFCQTCQRNCLVVDGIKQCCDEPLNKDAKGVRRIIGGEPRRRHPSKVEKEAILIEQDYCCLYCGQRFGATVLRRTREVVLRLQWDHVLPFSHTHNNNLENFAASCHVCNHFKRDKIFTDLEEVRVYVAERWQRTNNTLGENLPTVQNILSD